MGSDGWTDICGKLERGNFKMNDLFPLVASAYLSRRWPDEPLWLMSVAPPGTGKTATMGLFTGLPDAKLISSVTPASLISGWGGDQIDRSLFAELDGKLLMAKDFGSILHSGWTTANIVFSVLREAFDGHVSKHFGNCVREYDLKFNFVAAATDIYEQFRTFQSHLGERFMRFSLKPIQLPVPPPTINPALKSHVADWMLKCEAAPEPELAVKMQHWINRLATLVAKLRTEVVHEGMSHEVLEIPGFEGTARLEKQLGKMYKGLVAAGIPDPVRLYLVRLTCHSCIPPRKSVVIRNMLGREKSEAMAIAEETKLGYGVIRRVVNDMYALGLLDRELQAFPKTFHWSITKTFRSELGLLF